jgi:hypothetical protein
MSVKLQLQNKLINGDFSYFQRNITFATVANNTYTADRWVYEKVGSMVHTVARSTDVPTAASGLNSLLIDCTTASVSLAAGDNIVMSQRIEGNLLRSFKNKKMVMTFWVKATKTGTYCVSFRNASKTRSIVKEYTVNASNTWERKTIRFQHDPSGAWLYDTGLGMIVSFCLGAGSNFITSPDAWTGGDYVATVSQVNACDNVINDFQISDVCLVEDNEGQTRDPDFAYAGRDYFEELQLCQRYFEKSYPLDAAPGSITEDGRILNVMDGTHNFGTIPVAMSIQKRVSSSNVVIYNPVTGATGSIRADAGNRTVFVASVIGTKYFSVIINNQSTSQSVFISLHYTADAEL